MSRPIHFEIQADDLERAKAFYADVFGWTYEDYGQFTGSPYWGVHTGDQSEPGIDGGLMPRPAPAPVAGSGANAAVLTMGVEDFDTTAARIEAAGGSVALPKTALTGMAWQGYFLDTEGNTFGIHQPDTGAA
jgi:uncharacterized protein